MKGMLLTEPAILVHFELVRRVLLVLDCVVVTLFELRASQCHAYSHFGTSSLPE